MRTLALWMAVTAMALTCNAVEAQSTRQPSAGAQSGDIQGGNTIKRAMLAGKQAALIVKVATRLR